MILLSYKTTQKKYYWYSKLVRKARLGFSSITLNAAMPCCAIIMTSLNAVKNVFPKIVYWFNIKSLWIISWNKLFIVQCIFLIISHFYACTVMFTKIILHTMLWTLDGLKWLDRTAVVNLDWKRTKHINHKLNILKCDLYSLEKMWYFNN